MTMALVKNGEVIQVNLPSELRKLSLSQLRDIGWLKIIGPLKPDQPVSAGFRWEYGAPWSIEGDKVVGTWKETQKPQPYPSWTWEEGIGWTPPVARPDDGNTYRWDEDNQSWVLSQDRPLG